MTKNEFAKWFAGQMGIHAVLINALIDNGLISREELQARFEQALEAALQSSGGVECATAIAEVVKYLQPHGRA